MIDEQVGLEGGVERLEQPVGHRGAGEAELAHRAHVGRGETLVVDEVVIERRHQIEIGDLLGRDQLQRPGGVEARQADEGAADQRHRQQRAHAHGVIERHHAERAFAVAVEVLRDVGDRRGALGALAARHALRLRGGAGGVEHHRPGIGADARFGIAGIVQKQHIEPDFIALRRAERDTLARAPAFDARSASAGDVLVDQRPWPRNLQAVVDLVGLGAPVDRRDDDAGELAGPVQRRRLPAVLQHGDQMIAGHQAELVEAGHHGRDAAVPLRIGQSHRAVDDGERVGIALHAGEKAGAEIKHGQGPPAVFWRRRAPRPGSAHSRCSGTDGRREIRAAPPRRARGASRR